VPVGWISGVGLWGACGFGRVCGVGLVRAEYEVVAGWGRCVKGVWGIWGRFFANKLGKRDSRLTLV
jgi:hypothetical protein